MVVRLDGTINGNDVIFKKNEEGLWEVTVPSNLKGTYIISLTATDEAGNTSFVTGKLYVVDAEKLCVHLILDEYYAEIITSDFEVRIIPDEYIASVIVEVYEIHVMEDEYTAEVVRPLCCVKEGTRLEC